MTFGKWDRYTGGSHVVENLSRSNFVKMQEEKTFSNRVLLLLFMLEELFQINPSCAVLP